MKSNLLLKLCGAISVAVLAASSTTFHADGAERPGSDSAKATVPTKQMTLDAVVADVLEHNPELNFYSAEIAAAKGEARTAATWANPELSTTIGGKRVTGGGPAAEGVAWSVSVRQTFEWPGRIPLRKAIANQQIQLAELGFAPVQSRAGRADALSRLRLVRGPAESSGGPGSRGPLSCFARGARATGPGRNHAGVGTAHHRSDGDHDAPQGQRGVGGGAGSDARTESAARPAVAASDEDCAGGSQRSPPRRKLDALLAAARANNFEMRMRQVELEQQGFKVELAQKDAYPSFTVGPYFSQERARDRENQFGIGISMPLPLWNRNEGNIETAMARQKQAETSMYVTQRTIERQVVEKALTYQTKLTEMAKWRPESVAEFRKAAAAGRPSLPARRGADCNLRRVAETISRSGRGAAGNQARGARSRRNNWNCSPGLTSTRFTTPNLRNLEAQQS